ncbi:hypothetical protein HDU85_000943 [Gaertneriomyces sp. JEL0708]|nr:hypothetical protein HDU85_000943 [Gaertneriomyces sp. JEL0708]
MVNNGNRVILRITAAQSSGPFRMIPAVVPPASASPSSAAASLNTGGPKARKARKTSALDASSQKRLMHDLAELQKDPVQGVEVFLDEQDITQMCAVLTPMAGQLKGDKLHLKIKILDDYPSSSPSVIISTPFPHPNIFGEYICCDILQDKIRRSSDGYIGGYTPAYSLQAILMQLLSFFAADKVEQDWGGVTDSKLRAMPDSYMKRVKAQIQRFQCDKCGLGKVSPASSDEVCSKATTVINNPKCSLPILDSVPDVWNLITARLQSKDVKAISIAYPQINKVLDTEGILIRESLRCFFYRKSFTEDILGVGVNRSQEASSGKYTISSTFDLLSLEAYEKRNISEGPWGDPFNAWLPLALNEPHFKKGLPYIEDALMWLAGRREKASRAKFNPAVVIQVIGKMMNQMVVNLMKDVGGEMEGQKGMQKQILHASEKALTGYCSLLHLLLRMSKDYPEIMERAHEVVSNFAMRSGARSKETIPDLGEFLILLALTPTISWATVAKPFIEEMLARNVVWVLSKKPHLAFIETSTKSPLRMKDTFEASRTSLRLLMFQVAFLRLVVWNEISPASPPSSNSSSGKSDDDGWVTVTYRRNAHAKPTLDLSKASVMLEQTLARIGIYYGFPTPALVTSLANKTRQILDIDTWPEFLTLVSAPPQTFPHSDAAICRMLIAAIFESERCGYHMSRYRYTELCALRWAVEPGVCELLKRYTAPKRSLSFFPDNGVRKMRKAIVSTRVATGQFCSTCGGRCIMDNY